MRDNIYSYSLQQEDIPNTGNLIDGKWHHSGEKIAVYDKYSFDEIGAVSAATKDLAYQAIDTSSRAHQESELPPYERAEVFRRAANLLQQWRTRFEAIMIAETGFTIADVQSDVDRTCVTLSLCGEEATRITGETVCLAGTPGQHNRIGMTMRFPIGPVCCITPFNSPLNTVAHKVGPALAAGNPVILKPSALTPMTAALFCELLLESGLPTRFLALLHGEGDRVGQWLLEDNDIAFYSFTGSTAVGRKIQNAVGLRRTQLELGSIASTIVCGDADLELAIPKIAKSAFRKAGQVCTSIQRLYLDKDVFDQCTERLKIEAEAMLAGDPRDPDVRVGPMISVVAATRVEGWIRDACHAQARVITGGSRDRSILAPTIIVGAKYGLNVVDREVFAPCVVLMPFSNLENAVREANNTKFGLSAGIFTRNLDRAFEAARSLRFGAVHINETSSSRVDGMPFGGVKDSGSGKEGPKYAIRELTEERLITISN